MWLAKKIVGMICIKNNVCFMDASCASLQGIPEDCAWYCYASYIWFRHLEFSDSHIGFPFN